MSETTTSQAEKREVHGSWAVDDPRRWFVYGAKWWEFKKTGATMWASDVDDAEAEANRRLAGSAIERQQTQIDALAAQLTEVTRERDANVTHNRKLQQQLEHRTLTLGAEVKKREAAEAALAPLRAVVEPAKAVPFSIDRCTLYGPADAAREKVEALKRARCQPSPPITPPPRSAEDWTHEAPKAKFHSPIRPEPMGSVRTSRA